MKAELIVHETEMAIFKWATMSFLKIEKVMQDSSQNCKVFVNYDTPQSLFEAGKNFNSYLSIFTKTENNICKI